MARFILRLFHDPCAWNYLLQQLPIDWDALSHQNLMILHLQVNARGEILHSNSTAKAIVRVRGPEVTYGLLKLTPNVDSRAHSLDINGFTVRKGNDHFLLAELPLARALPEKARDDIIYNTFECDDDERSEYLEIDFEIPDYDEMARLLFRAVEKPSIPDMLFYEVEDTAGDWIPLEDVLLVDLLPDSFLRVLETSVVENLTEHHIDRLPMFAES